MPFLEERKWTRWPLWFSEGHQLTLTDLVNWEAPLPDASDPSAPSSNWGGRPSLIGTSLSFSQRPSVPTTSSQLRHPYFSAGVERGGHSEVGLDPKENLPPTLQDDPKTVCKPCPGSQGRHHPGTDGVLGTGLCSYGRTWALGSAIFSHSQYLGKTSR